MGSASNPTADGYSAAHKVESLSSACWWLVSSMCLNAQADQFAAGNTRG